MKKLCLIFGILLLLGSILGTVWHFYHKEKVNNRICEVREILKGATYFVSGEGRKPEVTADREIMELAPNNNNLYLYLPQDRLLRLRQLVEELRPNVYSLACYATPSVKDMGCYLIGGDLKDHSVKVVEQNDHYTLVRIVYSSPPAETLKCKEFFRSEDGIVRAISFEMKPSYIKGVVRHWFEGDNIKISANIEEIQSDSVSNDIPKKVLVPEAEEIEEVLERTKE